MSTLPDKGLSLNFIENSRKEPALSIFPLVDKSAGALLRTHNTVHYLR